mmetsp:Transcript_14629/g.30303  ORF Transcript_14629/g.30303 Transcript_14629/m.30303 type:complete len:292 (-) Transcript_14629:621-1496(-)
MRREGPNLLGPAEVQAHELSREESEDQIYLPVQGEPLVLGLVEEVQEQVSVKRDTAQDQSAAFDHRGFLFCSEEKQGESQDGEPDGRVAGEGSQSGHKGVLCEFSPTAPMHEKSLELFNGQTEREGVQGHHRKDVEGGYRRGDAPDKVPSGSKYSRQEAGRGEDLPGSHDVKGGFPPGLFHLDIGCPRLAESKEGRPFQMHVNARHVTVPREAGQQGNQVTVVGDADVRKEPLSLILGHGRLVSLLPLEDVKGPLETDISDERRREGNALDALPIDRVVINGSVAGQEKRC